MQLSISQQGLRNAERGRGREREREQERQQLQIVAWPDPMIASDQRLYWGSFQLLPALHLLVKSLAFLIAGHLKEQAAQAAHAAQATGNRQAGSNFYVSGSD